MIGDFEGWSSPSPAAAPGSAWPRRGCWRPAGQRRFLDLDPAPAASSALPLTADVTDDDSVRAAVATVAERLGALDVLVNNAGIGATGTVEDNSEDEWRRVLDVNLLGIVRASRAALPTCGASAPAIVNTCSIAAVAGLPRRALYSATKRGPGLTLAMAADHVGEGVRVNCVLPGTADTPWVRRLLEATPDPERSWPPCGPASRPGAWSPPRRSPTPSPTWPARWPPTVGTVLAVDGGMQGLRRPAT